jgi:hypothetical protein
MGRKTAPSRLATVTKIPGARRRGRPYKTLSSALAASASEREVLVLLRERLAARLGGEDLPAAGFAALARQFQQVDAKIRALDAAEEAAADEPSDDGDDAAWDPTKL